MVGRTTMVVAHRLSTVIDATSIAGGLKRHLHCWKAWLQSWRLPALKQPTVLTHCCHACPPSPLAPAAVVKKGTVVEQGTHDELLEKGGAYHTLVQMQQATGDVTSSDDEGSVDGYVPGGLQTVPEVPSAAPARSASIELSPSAQPASPRGWQRPSLGSRPSLGARPSMDAAASVASSDTGEQQGGSGGFFSVVKRVPGALAEALPDKETATNLAGNRAVMPGMQMQRGVSGIRRYVSFR